MRKEYGGLPEELYLQAFPRFVNPEGRLESITVLSNPICAQYSWHYVLLLFIIY